MEKDCAGVPVSQPEPQGEIQAVEVAGRRSWLRDYADKILAISFSSRAMSFRSSDRLAWLASKADMFSRIDQDGRD
ncbi:hypothetical protein RJ639_025151 [Escallonia herrerae]|uniref:Uncharacterized protein n=1 Tax=Escallonia herrerae TaxID=1293975 RepID=A0AA88UT86_9ASTE|nr:hypothetical protein RJ639_025151 [Escallonia herrerae]